jgi:hypothetical protein
MLLPYFFINCGSVDAEVRFILTYKQKTWKQTPKYFGWQNWMKCKAAVREGLIYFQASEYRPSYSWRFIIRRHMCADCVENVGASTPCYRDNFLSHSLSLYCSSFHATYSLKHWKRRKLTQLLIKYVKILTLPGYSTRVNEEKATPDSRSAVLRSEVELYFSENTKRLTSKSRPWLRQCTKYRII